MRLGRIMALKNPTPTSLSQKIGLCWLALADPARFSELEAEDDEALNSREAMPQRYRVDSVRNAYGNALLASLSAALIGAALGAGAIIVFGNATLAAAIVAALGAAVLLWATLAVRGWEVQTWNGATLTEQLNRWLFRGMYWIGTMLLALAAVWSAASGVVGA